MATWKPDPSFYPSPRMAMKAAPETLAYVATFDPERNTPDALAVVDVTDGSIVDLHRQQLANPGEGPLAGELASMVAGLTARAVGGIGADDKVVHSQLVPEIKDEPDYAAALAVLK